MYSALCRTLQHLYPQFTHCKASKVILIPIQLKTKPTDHTQNQDTLQVSNHPNQKNSSGYFECRYIYSLGVITYSSSEWKNKYNAMVLLWYIA